MGSHPFHQVDVFGATPYLGNPLAVIHAADGLTDGTMQRVARWTNLSETTFLTAPSDPLADYAVRIFTTAQELPFAGHPTLGSAHAWLEAGGIPRHSDRIVQQCGVGLVPVRRKSAGLGFAAPPLLRSGPPEDAVRAQVVRELQLDVSTVIEMAWVDNGPGWLGVLLDTAASVLSATADDVTMPIGLVGPHPLGAPTQFEVRALFPSDGKVLEDPATGSLNASLAIWLLSSGRAQAPYVASQGAAIGRAGLISVEQDADGVIWIHGSTTTIVQGSIEITAAG